MIVVNAPRLEHLDRPLGLGTARPRVSWSTTGTADGWLQAAYELVVVSADEVVWGTGRVESDAQVLVTWDGPDLLSRQRCAVQVRVWGTDGSASEWSVATAFEAGLLSPTDWSARFVSASWEEPPGPSRPAVVFRTAFDVAQPVVRARLYSSALGVYVAAVNGAPANDEVLAPGWTSYPSRVLYTTSDVTDLLRQGSNELVLTVADGWYRGKLSGHGPDNFGTRTAAIAQLELTLADGTVQVVATDDTWVAGTGPVLAADLYDGETHDARVALGDARPVELLEEPSVEVLQAPVGPPVRRTEELAVAQVLTTPAGKTVLDLGQNITGRMRFRVEGPAGTEVVLRHAEVMEHGEVATENLRSAAAVDRYVLSGEGLEEWEPSFTFHGFQFVEVSGWPGPLDPAAFTAVVLHSDLRRTGRFTCDHPLVDQLHRNVVWSMRDNFLSIPTDCPQRDERLGWTGDIQVFTPTAAFLYDTSGFLSSWLTDLALDQEPDGTVPWVVPTMARERSTATTGWGDAATLVPWELHRASGDTGLLAQQYASMTAWVDLLISLTGDNRLWDTGFQFGDWLDPTAPMDNPADAKADKVLVATAYTYRSARVVAETAALLGRAADAERYGRFADEVRAAWRHEFVAPSGRLVSDAQTSYALAVCFGLLEDEQRQRAGDRLAQLVEDRQHLIGTGFLGTPLINDALCATGHERTAFRLLLSTKAPSWLHAVTRGATTVWERWNALNPDGTVNGHAMTSFNHYALGAVAAWLHAHVGGLVAVDAGYKRSRIAPHPGPGIRSATTRLDTPYGELSCSWQRSGPALSVAVVVPPNTTSVVELPDGSAHEVGSGSRSFEVTLPEELVAQWVLPVFGFASLIGDLRDDPAAWKVVEELAPPLAAALETTPGLAGVSVQQVLAWSPPADPAHLAAFERALEAVASY